MNTFLVNPPESNQNLSADVIENRDYLNEDNMQIIQSKDQGWRTQDYLMSAAGKARDLVGGHLEKENV